LPVLAVLPRCPAAAPPQYRYAADRAGRSIPTHAAPRSTVTHRNVVRFCQLTVLPTALALRVDCISSELIVLGTNIPRTIAMKYEQWRDELFGHPPDIDPISLERSS